MNARKMRSLQSFLHCPIMQNRGQEWPPRSYPHGGTPRKLLTPTQGNPEERPKKNVFSNQTPDFVAEARIS
jgi:hypothetical protein